MRNLQRPEMLTPRSRGQCKPACLQSLEASRGFMSKHEAGHNLTACSFRKACYADQWGIAYESLHSLNNALRLRSPP